MPRTAASVTYSSRALVLRVRPLGEKDRIVTLFCAEKGRISAVAKGARGTKSKLAALAQPFVLARFLLAHGRSLEIVSQAQIENSHHTIVGDVYKTAWASLACEVVDSLPEGLPDPHGFEILSVTLASLDAAPDEAAVEAVGIWFETQWLMHQGYAPTIGFCVACGEKIESGGENRFYFAPILGGTLCAHCRGAEPGAQRTSLEVMRALHRLSRSRRAPQSLADAPFDLSGAQIAELGFCVRKTLLAHSNSRLKSAPWLEELRAQTRLKE